REIFDVALGAALRDRARDGVVIRAPEPDAAADARIALGVAPATRLAHLLRRAGGDAGDGHVVDPADGKAARVVEREAAAHRCRTGAAALDAAGSDAGAAMQA